MRWLFYYPFADKPFGGAKQARLAAWVLAGLGVDAYLLRDRQFFDTGFDDNKFFGVDVPVWPEPFEAAGPSLRPDDVLVLSETHLPRTLAATAGWRCRVGVNNQNGFHALRERPDPRLVSRRVEFALANAPFVATICRDYYRLPAGQVFAVPHWVVREPFVPAPAPGPRRPAVAYMPRKLGGVSAVVRGLVARAHPDLEWVPIEGMTAAQVADTLRSVELFFAAHHEEGCPTSGLEAMACGAAVVGFGGTAPYPHPYATPANGWWAREYVPRDAARAVARAIRACREAPAEVAAKVAAGRQTVGRYSEEAMAAGLEAVVGWLRTGRPPERPAEFARFGPLTRLRTARFLFRTNRVYLW